MAIPATPTSPGHDHQAQRQSAPGLQGRAPHSGQPARFYPGQASCNLKSGAMFEHRFRSADAIEKVVVDEVPMEFLYSDGDDYYFMNPVDYEQTVLKSDTLGDAVEYLTANLQIRVSYHDGHPVGIELPTFVELTVIETEPGLKSATASSSHQARQDRDWPGRAGSSFHQRGRKDPRGYQRRRLPQSRSIELHASQKRQKRRISPLRYLAPQILKTSMRGHSVGFQILRQFSADSSESPTAPSSIAFCHVVAADASSLTPL